MAQWCNAPLKIGHNFYKHYEWTVQQTRAKFRSAKNHKNTKQILNYVFDDKYRLFIFIIL